MGTMHHNCVFWVVGRDITHSSVGCGEELPLDYQDCGDCVVSGSKNLIHLDQDFNINILMLLIQVCAFSLR